MDFRQDINGLRAVAIIAVAFYHFGVAGFAGGFIGVDVFFVVSGYLMTKILLGNSQTPLPLLTFYVSRARRIVPALAVLCLVVYGIAAVKLSPFDLRYVSSETISALGFFSNFLFLGEAGYFDGAAKSKLFLHTWSLSVEWQFYLLYPLFLRIIDRLVPSQRGRFMVILAAFIISLVACIVVTHMRPIAAFFLLPTRAWEMLAGGLVFLSQDSSDKLSATARRALEWAGLALVALAITGFNEQTEWPGLAAVLPVAGTAMVLFAKSPAPALTGNLIAQSIGKWSYSIYLWHWPIVVTLYRNGVAPSAPVILSGLAASLLLGWLSFTLIEQPLRKSLQVKGRFSQLAMITAGLVVCALPAAAGMATGGYPGRYRGSDQAMLEQYERALSDWGYPANCGRTDLWGRIRLCSLRGQANNSALFVGDSEVEQWWSRFDTQRTPTNRPTLIFATYGGCPPLPGINRSTPGYRCPAFMAALEPIFARADIHTVIFGGAWPDYFLDAYGSSVQGTGLYALDATGAKVPVAIGSKAFDAAMQRFSDLISRLVNSGKRVVVLLAVPGRKENLSKTLYLAKWNNQKQPDLAISVDDFRRYAKPVIAALVNAAARGGAIIVDPIDTLCANGTCPVVTNAGVPIYMDGTHLRPFAVQERATFLDDIINQKLSACDGAAQCPRTRTTDTSLEKR